MSYKEVNRYVFVFDSIPDQYKTQELYDIVVSLYSFLIAYYPDKYIFHKKNVRRSNWSYVSSRIESYCRLACHK